VNFPFVAIRNNWVKALSFLLSMAQQAAALYLCTTFPKSPVLANAFTYISGLAEAFYLFYSDLTFLFF
jgi:hypothetical protein